MLVKGGTGAEVRIFWKYQVNTMAADYWLLVSQLGHQQQQYNSLATSDAYMHQ